MNRLLTFAGYAALGPITGPLTAAAVRSYRAGRPLAALGWLALIPLGLADLSWVLTSLLAHVPTP